MANLFKLDAEAARIFPFVDPADLQGNEAG
jgi:hypothetical protein